MAFCDQADPDCCCATLELLGAQSRATTYDNATPSRVRIHTWNLPTPIWSPPGTRARRTSHPRIWHFLAVVSNSRVDAAHSESIPYSKTNKTNRFALLRARTAVAMYFAPISPRNALPPTVHT